MNLDLVDAAEAVSVEELDEVPNGARTGHFPQALYRSRVLQLGVGSVSCGFFGHSGAVQRATLQQNPRARVIVQRFTADTKQSVPESHCRSCKRGKYRTVDRKKEKKRNDVSKLQQRNSRTFFNTGTQTQEGKFSRVGVSKQMPRESEILVLYPSLCNNSPPGLLKKKKKKSTREYERLVMTSLRVTCKL